MNADFLFEISNALALLGWLTLILAPNSWTWTDKIIISILITALAIFYVFGLSKGFNLEDFEKFSTLDGLMGLFENKLAVATGWVHYLAFDLMTGVWIKNNSQIHKINKWIIIPCLLGTFFAGPLGLLLYLIIRTLTTQKLFANNF